MEIFDGIEIFQELLPEELKALGELLEARVFGPAAVIYREGEAGDALNIIASGKVSINKTMVEGDQFCIASLKQGEVFGILSFLDGSRHDATIISESDTKLMVLSKEAFDRFLQAHPLTAAKVLRRVAIHLASIVRNMNSQQRDLMHLMFRKSK